jgi:hypothetical protein
VSHATDRSQDTAAGDAALTTVANPRRTRVDADGRPLAPQNARLAARD